MSGEPASGGSTELQKWTITAGVVAMIVYLPSLWNGFAYDDLLIIVSNPRIQNPSGLTELLTQPYWPGDEGVDFGLWRPTTSFLMWVLWQVSGGAALAFHLTNVALHGAVSAMVVRVSARVVPTTVAGVAGLLFAVHPVHVEAVANGVGMAELLAALLLLVALDLASGRDRLSGRDTLMVIALYALAFGAKESAVVLPGLLFVMDGVRRRLDVGALGGWLRDRALLLTGMVGVAGALLLGRTLVLGGVVDAMPALGANLLLEVPRIFTVGEIWAQTLRLVTVPGWLSPDYSPGVIPILTVWTGASLLGVAGVLTLLAGSIVAMRYLYRERSHSDPRGLPATGLGVVATSVAFGVTWFVTAVSPTSNTLFLTGVLLAERTLYLPSVGVAIVIAGLLVPLGRVSSADRRVRVGGVAVLLVLGVAWTTRTVTYIPAWRDQTSIFTHMAEAVPESGRAQWFMGDMQLGAGDTSRALYHYRVALGLLGSEYPFLMQTARTLLAEEQLAPALPFLTRAHEVRPDEGAAPQLLAVTTAQLEMWSETERWAAQSTEFEPGNVTAHHLLSVSLAQQERWEAAAEARVRMIALDPAPWQPWFWLAELRARAGDLPGARAAADSVRIRTEAPNALRQLDSLAVNLGFSGRP